MLDLIYFACVASLGVFVFSFAGFAGALTAVPLLAIRLDPIEFVPPLAMCVQLMNCRMTWESRHDIHWGQIRYILGGCAVGIPIGVLLLRVVPGVWMGLAISMLAVCVGVLFMRKVEIPLPATIPVRLGVGLMSGVLGGAATAAGPPVVFYALARGWARDRFRATLLAYFLFLGITSICLYAAQGMVGRRTFEFVLAGALPMYLASRFGVWLKHRTDEARFRRAILCIVTGTGLLGIAEVGVDLLFVHPG